MVAVVDGVRRRLQDARRDHPALERLLLTQEHYSKVGAGQQAGAVTYFGFLSVFPVLALSFFVVGWVAKVYPEAHQDLLDAIERVLPGLVGNGTGEVPLSDIEDAADTVGVFGLVGVLYAGLGWVSSLRSALLVVFEIPEKQRPDFLLGKARDLLTMVVLGVVLFVSVALAGFIGGFSTDVLRWLHLSGQLEWLVGVVAVLLGLAAGAVLFYAMFWLLAEPRTPHRSLWSGAVLGAVGFEALKEASKLLLASTRGEPAFQVFGTALILLVWINYFSRVILYAAAFAHVSATARAQRLAAYPADPVQGPRTPPLMARGEAAPPLRAPGPVPIFLAGAGTMVAALAVLTKMRKRDS
jgi:membrane protein